MKLAKLALFIGLVLALAAPSALAENANANCSNLSDPSDDGWTNHEQLRGALQRIEQASKGTVEVSEIGRSHQGRELWAARVGTGDRVLLVSSEIHGNEKTGTETLLAVLQHLGTSGSARAQQIREGITLVAVPMINPDGAELNRRQNHFPWAEVMARYPGVVVPAWYYNARVEGFDVNRDFNPDLDHEPSVTDQRGDSSLPGFYLTPEARALRDLYKELDAEFGEVDGYVDLHHMGPCEVNDDGEGDYVTMAIDYPPLGPDNNPKYAMWPEWDQDKSRRFALAAFLGLEEHAGKTNAESSPFFGGASRYYHPTTRDLPGQARSSFALNGTGTVLFEVRGQQHAWGQKQKGMLTQMVTAGLYGIAERMADGSVDHLNGNEFYNRPKYW